MKISNCLTTCWFDDHTNAKKKKKSLAVLIFSNLFSYSSVATLGNFGCVRNRPMYPHLLFLTLVH